MNSNLSKNDTYTFDEVLNMFWIVYKAYPIQFDMQGYYNDEPFLIREMIVNSASDKSFTYDDYKDLFDDYMEGWWSDNTFNKTKIHDMIYIWYKLNMLYPTSIPATLALSYLTTATRLYREAYNICIDKFHNAVKNTDYNEILRVLNSLDKQELGTLVDGITVALALPSSSTSSHFTEVIAQYFINYLAKLSKHSDIQACKTDREYRQMRSYMRRFANLLARALKQAHDNNPQAFFDNETNELYSVYVDPDMSVLNADTMFRTTCINELKSTLIFNPPILVEYKYPILLHKWEKKE